MTKGKERKRRKRGKRLEMMMNDERLDQILAGARAATVDTSRVRVERQRRFGEIYLGLALWRRLKLDAFFDDAMSAGREEIAWVCRSRRSHRPGVRHKVKIIEHAQVS